MQVQSLWRCSLIGLRRCLLATGAATGQTKARRQAQNYDRAARATVLHDANVYVAADADAQKISLVTPGHEVVIIERSGPWVKVFANTDIKTMQ